MLIYIRNVTATTTVSEVTGEYLEAGRLHILQDKQIPPYVTILRIHGPFLFGSSDKINDIIESIPEMPAIIVVRLRNMTALDATGLQALQEFADAVHATGRGLIFCGAPSQPAKLMKRAEFEEHVGAGNVCPNVQAALARAAQLFSELPEETRMRGLRRRRADLAAQPAATQS
ncbi:MAG: hypothetical protein DMG64_17295 [Acidobacteria bacterium]|nr:MAG: hypothetical protein DMG64_17295 [Acidobacteriota bacterium]